MLLHKKLFSSKGDNDYAQGYFPDEKSGQVIYIFPKPYKRFGLFVDKEGKWLGVSNTPGEWPVAYTSVKDFIARYNKQKSGIELLQIYQQEWTTML